MIEKSLREEHDIKWLEAYKEGDETDYQRVRMLLHPM